VIPDLGTVKAWRENQCESAGPALPVRRDRLITGNMLYWTLAFSFVTTGVAFACPILVLARIAWHVFKKEGRR
jgi:hypothetical protein